MQKTAVLLILFFSLSTRAQQHHYIAPTDPLVIKKLAQWQSWKFGLLMHWGTYSQWGVVESWSICPEDEGWTQRNPIHGKTYNEYKKNYEALQNTFNPVNFDPVKWATAAKDAGMKYVVFTTKHHDGFCMFDTKQTDYKITDSKTPFSVNPKANIAKEIFSAFRNEGFATGAYFSKPDWHNENYWWPYFPPKDRNVNYDPKKYPERWNAFKKFTYNQLEELMSGYGSMDILWLDGGWVRPANSIDTAVEWERTITYEQDIDMAKTAAMARRYQPGLLIVDRSVGNEYENYTTPEQEVPDRPLSYPWETCMTMATSWSHVPGDHYKPTTQLIHTLIKIVARGGNLLLNIGPDEKGEWDDTAYLRLKEIGEWMKINGESIYDTKPLIDNDNNQLFMTMADNGAAAYLFLLEDIDKPFSIAIDNPQLLDFKKAVILGTRTVISIKKDNDKLIVSSNDKTVPGKYALVIKLTR
jgi:alpha-L-fucosidase